MPGEGSNRDSAADIHPTNAGTEGARHDASGFGYSDPDRQATMSGKAAARPEFSRTVSLSKSVPGHQGSMHAEGSGSTPSQSSSYSLVQSSRLNIPGAPAPGRAAESSIWDWDTPLDTIGETSSYFFEPQGELIQEHRNHRVANTEFSIPQVANDSGSKQIVSAESATPGHNNFAVPKRPLVAPTPSIGVKRKSTSEQDQASVNTAPHQKRVSRAMSDSGEEETPSPMDVQPPIQVMQPQSGSRARSGTEATHARPPHSSIQGQAQSARPAAPRRTMTEPAVTAVLPARKVFPIQIGDKLFRLSGASISSDAPSYFSQFFEEQLHQNEGADSVRTLYIDRDPITFEDISLHLQGYHIQPRDGPHFVKLFADAQFFSLPRLTAQLFAAPIYIRIGDSEFQIPRDLFSNPGDSPNYFSLGFAIFFTTPSEVFPGLNQRTLLRPPSILPPSVPNRSARTFADILHILKGYPVDIKSEEHRTELLRDARYFHLKGLEQRLIPHTISYNLARKLSEIVVRLEDIRQSGISFVADGMAPTAPLHSPGGGGTGTATNPGWVHYQRPYVDSEAYSLIVEIGGGECTMLSITPGSSTSPARFGRATLYRQTLSRITSLFSVIANKMNLPVIQPLGLMMMERGAGVASLPVSPGNSGLSEERVKVRIGADADVIVDGHRWLVDQEDGDESEGSSMNIDSAGPSRTGGKRVRTSDEDDEGEEWVVKKAQWRIRVQQVQPGAQAGKSGMEVILGAVKIEAFSSERGRNAARGFLT